MLKKCNKALSILLAFALVFTMLGSDFASVRVFAEEGEEQIVAEQSAEPAETVEQPQEQPEENQEEVSEEPQEPEPETQPEVTDEAAGGNEAEAATEASSAAPEAAATENSTEEAATEGSSDVVADAATEASSEAATEASSEAATEASSEEVVAQNLVTVSYRSTKGGSVSNKEETINIDDESARFVGATAAAWNDEYTFVNWTDADGNVVCEEATFVPKDVKVDSTFTANFKAVENIEEKMPAIIAEDVHEGGMVVSVRAEEGLFPAGTELKISAISDDSALATAKEELGENVTAAKGVDISFVYEGNDIQPADSRYVHVTLALEDSAEFDNVSVLHDHEGNVETIDASVSTNAEGNVEAVSFDANQFSIFIIADEDDDSANEKKVVEFRFYDNRKMEGEPFNTQLVKNGDSLSNPGVPLSISNAENQVFIKWETEDGEDVKYEAISGITAETPDVVNIIPVVETTYYIQYHGIDDEIAYVASYVLTDESPEEDKYINTVDEYSFKADSGNAFDGWSTSSDLPKGSRPYVQDDGNKNVADVTNPANRNLYAVIVEAYWIHFEGNGSGASYVEPTYLVKGDNLTKVKDITATRDGYEFAGWALSADGEALTDEQLASLKIEEMSEVDEENVLRLYAVWTPEGKTKVSVIFWQQKITDSYDTPEDARKYDYKDSYIIEDVDTGTTIDADFLSSELTEVDYLNHGDEGFEYRTFTVFDTRSDSETTVAEPRGNTVVNVYYDRKVMTLTFMRYGVPASDYIETTENVDGTTYYWTEDGENFYPLTRNVTVTYTPMYQGQPYTDTVYYRVGSSYHRTTNYSRYGTYYGRINNQYVIIDILETRTYTWKKSNGEVYEGTRYKRVEGASNSWYVVEEIKGLYGQTLLDSGNNWPTSADWYAEHDNKGNGTGLHTTFLDAFLESTTFYGNEPKTENIPVRFHKQNIGEADGYTQANSTTVSSNSTFYLTDKYNGFRLYKYAHGGGKQDATVDQAISIRGTALDIYYERLSYDLQFIDVDPTDNTEQNAGDAFSVQYEAPLSSYGSYEDPITHDGYIFDGWYEDKTGTVEFNFSSKMPANNKAVYGIWKPTQYRVTLKANGGEFVPQSGWTDEDFDGEGNPFFYVDPNTEILESGIVGLFKNEGYTFTGYYYDDEDPDAGKTFLYGKINRDIILKADWRRLEAVKVVFDAAPADAPYGSFDEGTTHSDGFDYASNSEFVMAAPPTTVDEEYIFMGWKFHKGTDTNTYVPNARAKIVEENISTEENTVILDAVYEKKGGEGTSTEETTIVYDPGDITDAVLNYTPASETEIVEGKQVKITKLKVNQKVTALGAIYTADGWEMESWNTMPDGTGVEVELDKAFIAADNLDNPAETNSKINTLYAQWKQKVVYTVTITAAATGSEKEVPYNGYEQEWKITGLEEELPYTITVTSEPEDVVDGLTPEAVVLKEELSITGKDADRYPLALAEDMFDINITTDAEIIWNVSGEIALVITPRPIKLTVEGKTDNLPFTGAKQEVNGLEGELEAELKESLEGDKADLAKEVQIIFDEANAHAEGVTPGKYDMGLEKTMFTFENTNFVLADEDFELTDGYLTIHDDIEGIELYASSDDETSPYNGSDQTFEKPVRLETRAPEAEPEFAPASLPRAVFNMIRSLFVLTVNAGDDDVNFSIGDEQYVVENLKATATRKEYGDENFVLKDGYEIYHLVDGQKDGEALNELFNINTDGLGILHITKVPVTITIDNKTKTAGAADPTFTSTIEGLQGTDTIDLTYDRVPGEEVGVEYTIFTNEKERDLEGKYTNYTFVINTGILTITQSSTPPSEPTPPPSGPTPPTTTPDEPAPPAPAPAQAVLGARREEPTGNGQAVLGARRARTEDTTNDTARVFAIVVAAAASIALLLAGKKKEENEEG